MTHQRAVTSTQYLAGSLWSGPTCGNCTDRTPRDGSGPAATSHLSSQS